MKMRLLALGLFATTMLGASGGGCDNHIVGVQDYGSVTGRVLDATTNRPIANATVSVGSIYVNTADAKGAFTMPNIPIGTQTVTARMAGFTTASTDVQVEKGQTSQAGFLRLVPVSKPDAVPTLQPPATPTPVSSAPALFVVTPPPTDTPSPAPSGT
jgi:hypothetical protein